MTVPGDVELRELPDPRPGPGSVVVKVHAAGICGSDVHGVQAGRMPGGRTLGHELSGTVAAVGSTVDDWPVGTPVAVNPIGSCGSCPACAAGLPFRCPAVPNLGLGAPGGFAEYTVVPQGQLHRLPGGVDVELGCRAEPLAVALRAVSLAEPAEGDAALVYGVGSIGLNVILALRALRAGTVVAVGRSAARRAAALRAGADVALDSRVEPVADYAAGAGLTFRHVFECSGSPDAIPAVLPVLALRGTVVAVALTDGPSPVALRALVNGQQRLIGSCAFDEPEFRRAVRLIVDGRVDVGSVITDRIPLAEAPAMLRRLREPGTPVAVVVQPWR